MKLLISIAGIIFLFSNPGQSQELSGHQIIAKVNELFNQESTYSRAKMTIITTSGQERTFEYDSWSKNKGEKNLIRYLAPSRVKNQATLMLNHADDIWMYFPRTQRVRKLATHAKKQKMEGSDFSYEDMGSGDAFINNFIPHRLEDEKMEKKECYNIDLVRKKESTSAYSHLIMWVIKDNFLPVVIDYYDENNPDRLIKRLIQSDIQIIEDIPTAMKMIMYNKTDNTQTSIELLTVKYNTPIDDDMFTERGLKK